ncbi:unnamed protein product [Urochloa humidicola]
MPSPESAAGGAHWRRSASAIVGESVTGQHLLHIDGYSRTKEEIPTGKPIQSRPFRVGDHSWRIRYYPNGQTSEFAKFISITLVLDKGVVKPFKAQAKFSLLDSTGQPVQRCAEIVTMGEYSVCGCGHGIGDFIRREWLEKSEYLLNDCFKISCDVMVCEELHTEDRIAPGTFVVVPPSDMNQHLGNLFRTKDGADVTFQVAGETFKAHRFLLAT